MNYSNFTVFNQTFKRETRFTSKCPPNEIIKKIEEAAKPLGFDVHKKNYKVKNVHMNFLILAAWRRMCGFDKKICNLF